jgi:hypothetical protein
MESSFCPLLSRWPFLRSCSYLHLLTRSYPSWWCSFLLFLLVIFGFVCLAIHLRVGLSTLIATITVRSRVPLNVRWHRSRWGLSGVAQRPFTAWDRVYRVVYTHAASSGAPRSARTKMRSTHKAWGPRRAGNVSSRTGRGGREIVSRSYQKGKGSALVLRPFILGLVLGRCRGGWSWKE